jgi:23S rRNA (guanosine2251-2'-O)-methyltransferase
VKTALQAGVIPSVILVDSDEADSEFRALVDRGKTGRLPLYQRPTRELDALSRGAKHEGVLCINGEYSYIDMEQLMSRRRDPDLFLCLDEVTDPGNVGSIYRSAAAFGVDGVIFTKDRSATVNDTVVRVSMGATELLRTARVTNLVRSMERLAEADVLTIGLEADTHTTLDSVDLTQPIALVMGSEGKGLRRLVRERCTMLAKIPMQPPLDSLNVAMATAVALYEVQRQRQLARKLIQGSSS